MAHLWICAPFLVVWFSEPDVRRALPPGSFDRLQAFVSIVVVYLLARTYLAFKTLPGFDGTIGFRPSTC
jgi:hypothetical protein